MGALFRRLDWSKTALGPVSDWPQSLLTTISTCIDCAFPILIWWGPKLVMLYNDEYRAILGSEKHPKALGTAGQEVWPEIWHVIGPMLNQVVQTGQATRSRDLLLLMNRNGFEEEAYFSFSYSPIRDETGGVGGVFTPVIETTASVVGERRLRTLRELGARSGAGTLLSAAESAAEVLSNNDKDVPFALIYKIEHEERAAVLLAAAGVSAGSDAAPQRVDLEAERCVWPLSEALKLSSPLRVDDLRERLADAPSGAWPQPPATALLMPIVPPGREMPSGLLVVGVNPRRPLDEEHLGFFDLIAGQIGKSFADALTFEEERRRAEALAEIDRAKTAFFSNVSHEFRTPLTLMLGPLEDLLAGPGSCSGEQSRALIEVAHRNALRLLKLVNSLLDFSRLEAGRARADFEPVDLTALTAELASNFRAVAEKAGLKFEVADDKLDAPVYVDRDMWEKLVLNLLSNAFKFTLDGCISVALRRSADRKAAELTVSDTGAGIPSDQLPKLFDRFYQVEGQKGRSFEGSGIGLSLVKEIVSLHGGKVEVESEPGRGSSFRVRIPFGIAHLPPEQVVMDASAIGLTSTKTNAYVEEALRWIDTPAVAPTESEGLKRPRILIADDNADMRHYMARLLGDRWTIELVEDGIAALNAIKATRPDLVLSDVMMPKLDGFGLLKALRNDAELQDLPVIMLSARAGEEARVEGLDAGADDYLTKPFSARELVARVSANLKIAEVRRQASEALKLANDRLAAENETVDRLNRQLATESERLRHLFEQAPGFMCVLRGPSHVFELANDSYLKLVGRQDLIGKQVREAFPEVEGQDFFEMLDRVFANGEPVEGKSRPIKLQRNGRQELRYLDFIYQPIADERGVVTGIFVEGYDVTDRVKADQQRVLLINELNHRVKNTLATVQSLAMQTMRNTERSADARELFESRLTALARAHDVLTVESWEGAELRRVANRALEPFASKDGRVSMEGPDVWLTPKQALALSMALHELATNATKYGALSNDTGTVRLSWVVALFDSEGELELTWTEQDGPPVSRPTRSGFGSRLIQRNLAHDLGGGATIDYRPQGVVSVIRSPIEKPNQGNRQ